jgi:pimeloyl-ACP methyl ester carboxylesterase
MVLLTLAGTVLVVFPRSGHMTFADQPDLFIKTINDFLHQK